MKLIADIQRVVDARYVPTNDVIDSPAFVESADGRGIGFIDLTREQRTGVLYHGVAWDGQAVQDCDVPVVIANVCSGKEVDAWLDGVTLTEPEPELEV